MLSDLRRASASSARRSASTSARSSAAPTTSGTGTMGAGSGSENVGAGASAGSDGSAGATGNGDAVADFGFVFLIMHVKLGDLLGDLAEFRVRDAGDGLDDVDTVVDGAFNVVEVVLSGATQHEGCCPCLLVLLPKDCDAVAADLEGLDDIDGAHLVGHGGTQTCQGCGANNAA